MQQMSCLKSTDASWSLWLAVNRPPMDHCGRFASNNEYYRCQQITTNSEQRKPNNINKCVQLPTYADNVALPATAAAIYCRVHSKLRVQNSSTFQRTFKDPNCFFQAPKLSTKSHTLDADIQNLDCNEVYCTVLTNTVMIKAYAYRCLLQNCQQMQNLQDLNSRIFKYFQAPYLFSSTFKGLDVFYSKFKDFSSMLWTLHWYLQPAGPTAANLQQRVCRAHAGTDGRTPYRFIDPAPHTMRAVLVLLHSFTLWWIHQSRCNCTQH